MCRSNVKLRSLNSFFNLDGCVYYLTKKDKFCTLYSSCKFYAVCVQIGDTFWIWKKCGNWCCTVIQRQMNISFRRRWMCVTCNIQSVTCLGEEMRCCCCCMSMRTACLKTDTVQRLISDLRSQSH